MASIKKTGTLFDLIERDRLFERALDKTLAYGVDLVGQRTPVDTGNLKSRLDSESITNKTGSIFSDVSYSIFVEKGTRYFSGFFMFENATSRIEQEFIKSILEVFDE